LSGIVGIFHRDGAPLGAEELQPLAASLLPQYRNAARIWSQGPLGLGYAPRDSAAQEQQPAMLADSRLSITADVRLDSRAQLRAQLVAGNREILPAATDAQLLLHAYALWGQNCVARLRGDFAFAIWDAQSQTLFCARDHFGIKPFYYALFDSLFIFSNSLNTLRGHPEISAALNDFAVADFLLFGLNCDNSSTTFRDVQRLPPAHTLLVSRDAIELRRYWEVPADGRIRFSRPDDYVQNFLAVWDSAVADRLDTSTTGILLSGGLDSSAVAATAKEHSSSANPVGLRAFTFAHENLPADREPQFASLLAHSLGIPWQCIVEADRRPFAGWEEACPFTPEPVDDPLFASHFRSFQELSAACRVLLSGEGSDNLMHFEMWPYAADLRRRGEWIPLAKDLARYAWRRPFPWRGLRVRLQGVFGYGETVPQPFPKWIAPEFAKRCELEERWKAGQPLPEPWHPHPIHPTAVASLYLPQWTRFFELENPSVTKCAVEVRYPFLDLRVVEYLLAIPPFPWFFQKTLLRRAMAGRVLDPVRLRPKAPFVGDPLLEHLRRTGSFEAKDASAEVRNPMPRVVPAKVRWTAESGAYIIPSLLSPLHGKMSSEQVNQNARPFCFNFWLQSLC
jgi:asparagine synthase (glutamine-hydrolysing)